jgi:hypothetical protein
MSDYRYRFPTMDCPITRRAPLGPLDLFSPTIFFVVVGRYRIRSGVKIWSQWRGDLLAHWQHSPRIAPGYVPQYHRNLSILHPLEHLPSLNAS